MSNAPKKFPPIAQRKMNFAIREAAKGKGIAGETIGGSGPPNRHGMPKLPPGQKQVPNWPVLDLGEQPDIARDDWRLEIFGLVEEPTIMTFDDLMALPQVEEESDFHCVTTWSKMDMRFGGVRLREVLGRAVLKPEATHILVGAYDKDWSTGEPYTTNLSLGDALEPDVLLVHSWNGKPLPREHGGPVRIVTPQLYAWKGAKWVKEIEVLDYNEPGFWERRGYSDTALPWYDDRYSRR